MNEPKVNDGKGLLDNEGICDKGILICNDAVKDLTNGQYLNFCNRMVQIAQIFANLKKGIKDDMDSMKEKVECLKAENKRLVEQITGMPVITDEKDGAE